IDAEKEPAHVARDSVERRVPLRQAAEQERRRARAARRIGLTAQDLAYQFIPFLVLSERVLEPGSPLRIPGEGWPAHQARVQVLPPVPGELAACQQFVNESGSLRRVLIAAEADHLVAGRN